MTTGATGQLGLALPVQGELSGTWGDTVNNGITQYTNIAIAATLTLTNDGAVTLANTTGDASASNITSSLTGAGTVTAQFAIVKVTGTLTTTKVVTFGSAGSAPYSKTYLVVNAATGGSVSFTAYGGTGVTIAVGESAYVYYDGTNIVKVSSTVATGVTTFSAGTTGFTPSTATSGAVTLAGTLATTNGGTGLTSFTSGGVVYASSTSALTTGSALSFDGTNLGIGTSSPSAKLQVAGTVKISNSNAANELTFTGTDFTNLFSETSSGFQFGTTSTGYLAFLTNNTEQARIDSSGNLGLGVTPTSVQSGYKAIQIGATVGGGIVSAGTDTYFTNNAYVTGGSWYFGSTGYATYYNQSGGNHIWITSSASGTAGGVATMSERMRLDASGNLGVGTTSPANPTGGKGFEISNASGASIRATNSATYLELQSGSSANYILSNGAYPLLFYTNGSERARIDSSGNLLVGTTTAAAKLTIASTTNPALTLPNIAEIATISATAATGTINYDATTQSVLYYTTNASGNFTMNIRGNSGLSLNSMMSTGQSLTVAFLCTNGSTAYYQSAMTIDGSSVTPKWQGGTAPTTGNASAIDSYVYTIIKTASATYTVLASQTKFA